jgi:hypothetical protein
VAEMLGRPSELSGGTHRIELHDHADLYSVDEFWS